MIGAILRFITPLRICGIYLLIDWIKWSSIVDTSIENGHNPELGGLVPYLLGGFALLALALDLLFSLTLRPKINWIVQSIIVLIGAFAIFLAMN